jgi:predicted metal-binding protein
MKPLKELIPEISGPAIKGIRPIPASRISVADWVRLKCMYGCTLYGRSWSCPPASPSLEEARKILREYRTALFVTFKPGKDAGKMNEILLEMERKLFLEGYCKAFAFFPSPCSLCKKCAYPKDCKHPGKKRPTPEAMGIDVFRTAANAGIRMDVLKEKKPFSMSTLVLAE